MKVKDMNVMRVPISKVKLGRNSRTSISYEELDGMMQSIKEIGLLQPIGVVRKGTGYEVCYGNRRFLAASKLGWSSIPAVVHDQNHAFETDLKNLTENVQRRQLTLNEVGRHIEIMKGEGLGNREAAVKMGVSTRYLIDAVSSYKSVPENFRDDIEVRSTPKKGSHTEPGKLSMHQASAINHAALRYKLNEDQKQELFKAAKAAGIKFNPKIVKRYALNVLSGRPVLDSNTHVKTLNINALMPLTEYDRLHAKYVLNGPFKGVGAVARAILKGELVERMKFIESGDE